MDESLSCKFYWIGRGWSATNQEMSSKSTRTVKEDSEVFSIENSAVERSGAAAEKGISSEPKGNVRQNIFRRANGKFAFPKLSVSFVLICVSLVVQLIFCVALIVAICTVHGFELLFAISFLLLNIGSLFWTFEVLLDRSKKMLIVSSCFSLAIFLIAMILLFALVWRKSGEQLEDAEKLAAFTILIQFVNVLAIMHCTYEMYYKVKAELATSTAQPLSAKANTDLKSDFSKSAAHGKSVPISGGPRKVAIVKTDPKESSLSSKTGSESRTRSTATATPDKETQDRITASTAPTFDTAKEARQMRYFDSSSQSGNTSNFSVNSMGAARI